METAGKRDRESMAKARRVEIRILAPIPGKRAVGTYRVCPTRRGAYELGDHFVRYASPLGLLVRQTRLRARSPVKVYPDVALVRTYELLARQDRDAGAALDGSLDHAIGQVAAGMTGHDEIAGAHLDRVNRRRLERNASGEPGPVADDGRAERVG